MRRRTSARRIPVQQLEDGADILHAPTDRQSGSEEVSHTPLFTNTDQLLQSVPPIVFFLASHAAPMFTM